jgi:hypothetical protein
MLLRGSSQAGEIDLTAAVNSHADSGIPNGTTLNTFAEAVLGSDDAALASARNTLCAELGPAGLVDSAAIVATFMQMDRIADATGIPLDTQVRDLTDGFRAELGLNDYGSAQNTPGVTAA